MRPCRATVTAIVLAGIAAACGGDEPRVTAEGERAYGFPEYDMRPIPVSPILGQPSGGLPPPPAETQPPPAPAAPSTPRPAAPASSARSSGPATGSYKVAAVTNGGTLRGFCRLGGNVPAKRPTVTVFKHQDLGCGTGHPSERAVWRDSDKALGNCVVYLKSIKQGKDFPEAMRGEERQAFVDQKGCVYVPHVAWARAQTQLAMGSSDAAEHNVHGFRWVGATPDTMFNIPVKPMGRVDDVEGAFLDKAGLYLLKCDIHPWMSGFVVVLSHPYVDVTSAEDDAARGRKAGEFVIEDVPEGDYDLVCWHEGMVGTPVVVDGKITDTTYSANQEVVRPVKVAAGKTTVVDEFVLPYQ